MRQTVFRFVVAALLVVALPLAMLTGCGGGTSNSAAKSAGSSGSGGSSDTSGGGSVSSSSDAGSSNDNGNSGNASSGNNQASPSDPQFSYLSWDGNKIEFTAKEKVTLTGISVFAGDQEFKGKYVSNSSGDMGYASGTTMRPGSSVGFNNGLIIYADTTASCAIDTGGAKIDKVCFYLSGGEKLERALK